jgi:hypothetical protein
MTDILKSSADILGIRTVTSGDIGVKTSRLFEAQKDLTNPVKFTTRQELEKSGLSRKFDELQAIMLNVKSQDTIASITKSRLQNEQVALKQVNDIIVRFQQEMSQQNSAAGSDQEKVNRALVKLEAALRSQDTSGKYVWGGKDTITDPLLKMNASGNKIAINLVNDSNIENQMITNNFSITAPNETIVTVSSQHEVRESFLYPGHGAISKTIGFLNMIKENANAKDAGNPPLYSEAQISSAQREQSQARGLLKIQIDLEAEKVDHAFDINKKDIKVAMSENKDLFSGGLVERTQKIRDLLVSLTASITLSNIDSKVFDSLSNLKV